MNNEAYVGNEMEIAMLKSAYGDLQYKTSTVALLEGAKGSGKSTLVAIMMAKAGLENMLPYSGKTEDLKAAISQKPIVWLEDIHTLSPNGLKHLADACNSLGISGNPCLLILTYTPMQESSANASFMAFLQEVKSSLSAPGCNTELLDIEIKPLKLADVHFLISKLYPENEFHSNFANQIHKASQGNPLMIHSILERMEQEGNLGKQGNGKWLAANKEEVITNIKIKIESEWESESAIEEQPIVSESATKKYDSIAEIEAAIEELETMLKKYKMALALETANQIADSIKQLTPDGNTAALMARVLTNKCKALIFFGLYEEAFHCANEGIAITGESNSENKAMLIALKAQSLGYQAEFKECFALFDMAINMALACQSNHTAAQIYVIKIPFLLEYPLLDKVIDAYERGAKHAEKGGNIRAGWEMELYLLYYQRYVSKLDQALEKSAEVLEFFKNAADPKFESRTLNVIGLLYSSKCNFEKAGEYFKMAENCLKSINDKVGLIGIYNNMGHLNFDTGQYEKSIYYFKKAFEISSSIKSKSLMLVSYTGIGSSYIYLGKNTEAEQSMLKGLEIAETMENKSSLAYVISALGDLYSHTGDTDKALEVYLRALDIDRELKDMPSVVCDLTNIANVYITTRDVDNGIRYLEGIEDEMPDYADNVVMRAAIHNTFGNLYAEKGDTAKALEHYNAALKTNIKCGDHICTSLNYYNMGLLYFDDNDYDKAIECFENSVKYDRLSGDKMQLAQHLQRLAYCNRMIDEAERSQQQNMEAASLFRSLNLMDEYGVSLRAAGDDARVMKVYANAEKLLNESIEVLQQQQNYLELADSYAILGVLLTETNMNSKAEELFRKALSLHNQHHLSNYERYSKIAQQMAWMYTKNKKYNKAVEVFLEMRKGCDQDYYLELTLMIAKILEEGKDPNAEFYYMEAAELVSNHADVVLKSEVMGEVGEYLAANGKAAKGIAIITEAIEALECDDEYKLNKAHMMVTLADAYEAANMYTEAIETYQSAKKIFEELDEKWEVACAYNNIGYLYDTQNKCAYAAQYYHLAFEMYKSLDNKESMAKNLFNEALMYERMGATPKAAQTYQQVLGFIEEEENPAGYATTALNVAKCMSTYTDSDDVLKFTQKAYALFQEIMQIDDMVACQEFMALFSFQKGNHQAAKTHLSKLLAIKEMKRDHNTQLLVYNSAASVSFYMNEMQDTVEYFQKTIAIATEMDSWRNIALCNLQMAAKMSIDDEKYNAEITYNGKKRKIWEFCVECINFAIKIADSEKMTDTKSEAYELLANIYENIGDTSKMMEVLDLGINTCTDSEQRFTFLMRKAVAFHDLLDDKSTGLSMMLDIANETEQQNNWETRVLANIWLCYWQLQESPQDVTAIQTLQNISQRYGYLLFKVPGLTEFLKGL